MELQTLTKKELRQISTVTITNSSLFSLADLEPSDSLLMCDMNLDFAVAVCYFYSV